MPRVLHFFSAFHLSGGDSVQCHTDLATCCSNGQGYHRRDWYSPDGTRLSFISGIIYQSRTAQRVDLRRRSSAILPSGIYRCDIPTLSFDRATVYVGIYTPVGGQQTSAAFFTLIRNSGWIYQSCYTIVFYLLSHFYVLLR